MLVEDKLIQKNLSAWYNLRQHLETALNPLTDVANFFLHLPRTKFYTDPYDPTTWPTPWELISENEYCNFNLILGICYTIQLTERFKKYQPKINVAIDNINKTVYYLLFVEDKVYGYGEEWIDQKNLPKSLKIQKKYVMPILH